MRYFIAGPVSKNKYLFKMTIMSLVVQLRKDKRKQCSTFAS